MNAVTDQRLMARVAEGDTDAFDELYRRHGRSALALARRLGARQDLAEDIVQEAFIALWRRAGQYRPDRGDVSTWLAAIVRNRVTDAWRRAAARPVEVTAEAAPEQVARGVPVAERVAMRTLVATLPPEQREAIVLAYVGGLTNEQIADACGAPLGTVKGRLRLGLEKLRFALAA